MPGIPGQKAVDVRKLVGLPVEPRIVGTGPD
jgi:hypothetical protein